MTLTYLLFSSTPLAIALLLCSLLSCFWEVLQNLGSDHLPILLIVPLFPVFCPKKRSSSIFRKLIKMTLLFTLTLTVLLQRSMHLFFILLLYISATECCQIFYHFWSHQTPTSSLFTEVKKAVGERCKAFAVAEVIKSIRLTFLLPDMPCLSSQGLG